MTRPLVTPGTVARAALGVSRPPRKPITAERTPPAEGAREVCFASAAPLPTPVYVRDKLQPGDVIAGPAVIDQMDSTTVIFPGDIARIDPLGNIIVAVGQSHD